MKWKIALLVIANIILSLAYFYFVPDVQADVAIAQLEEGGATVRSMEKTKNLFWTILPLVNLALLAWIVWKPLTSFIKENKMKNVTGLFLLVGCMLLFVGCKDYDVAEYVEIGNSETAFVIELEDNDGARFDSAQAVEEARVAARRIQIPHRWHSTGRMWFAGEWIDTVGVVIVDRAPVTREWTAETNSGTVNRDQGIWVESRDSIGFSVGFNCTARVEEDDASVFLYNYPAERSSDGESTIWRSELESVMDEEIRNMIQSVAADYAAQYDLDELREKKQEMVAQIRDTVIPFFQERGITITTVGMFGGFAYENDEIQQAIDQIFVAQQMKNEEAALLEAMEDREERLRREGVAIANQAREEAQGQADAVRLMAEAEAASITLVNEALQEARENPIFLQIKALEVESQRIEAWNGTVPSFIMGSDGGGGFLPMIQIPESATQPNNE